MIISKAGTFKLLRVLCIFCAIAMGFMTLVGTSEDDATDALGVDDSFNETADIELESVTVTEGDIGAALQPLAGNNCGTLSVNEALAELEAQGDIEDLDKLDISSIKLEFISGTYTANWTPDIAPTFSCKLSITGTESTTIAATAIDGVEGDINDVLTEEQEDVINYYLAHRGEVFTYCAVCEDTEGFDTFNVTYDVLINVRIKGDVDVL